MSRMEYDRLEKELRELTVAQLHSVMRFISESTDEQFDSLIARKIAADYVMREVRERLRGEVSGLHAWIREAFDAYPERSKHGHRRAAIRAESGRTEELISEKA